MLWKALIYVLEKQMFPEFIAKNMCISVQLLHLIHVGKHIPSYEGFTTSAYHFFLQTTTTILMVTLLFCHHQHHHLLTI